MKILIVSTCRFKEHESEFVRPLIQILQNNNYNDIKIKKYYEKIDFDLFDVVILSGTALLDFDYLNYIENFKDLKNTNKIVIGICAGLQILANVYSLDLKDFEIIGKKEIKLFDKTNYGLFLTSKVLYDPKNFEVLGWYFDNNKKIPVFLRDNNIYLFAFHPEVLNHDLLIKTIKKEI
jgi:GMP synthase-like glutamine amidotransferase